MIDVKIWNKNLQSPNFAEKNRRTMLKNLTIILFISFAAIGFSAESSKENKKTKIELRNRKCRPLTLIGEIDAYYLGPSCELNITFPESEGWANLFVSTVSGESVLKDRFHTSFEFKKYIGIPEEPWKIEITTTGGGDYEGWLIL